MNVIEGQATMSSRDFVSSIVLLPELVSIRAKEKCEKQFDR